MTITEFLEARIAEDEAMAREAGARSIEWRSFGRTVQGGEFTEPDPEWGDEPDDGYGSVTIVYDEGAPHEDEADHIARHDPARVLAECAAKRAIIESLTNTSAAHAKETHLGQKLVLAGMDTGLRLALNALATPYHDHPDYRQEWAL